MNNMEQPRVSIFGLYFGIQMIATSGLAQTGDVNFDRLSQQEGKSTTMLLPVPTFKGPGDRRGFYFRELGSKIRIC